MLLIVSPIPTTHNQWRQENGIFSLFLFPGSSLLLLYPGRRKGSSLVMAKCISASKDSDTLNIRARTWNWEKTSVACWPSEATDCLLCRTGCWIRSTTGLSQEGTSYVEVWYRDNCSPKATKWIHTQLGFGAVYGGSKFNTIHRNHGA